MPHSKQAKKRLRQNVVHRARNKIIKSRMRTRVKKFLMAVDAGDLENARKELPLAMKELDKAAKRHVIHRNTASRKISRLSARLGKLEHAGEKG